MPSGHVMMAMTLDGYIARKDYSLDWLMKQDTRNEDHGFAEFIDSVDVIVMGSGSFRALLGFGEWPYTKPVIVLSRSMTADDIPEPLQKKVEISQESPKELMASLDAKSVKRVYVDGGAVVQSFLRAGLIADMKVTLVPVLIGDGIRLFGELDRDLDLALEEVRSFRSGLIDMRYRVR